MGNKNIGGAILDDLKALPKKILKPYYKNGKLNANKVAIDGIPFVIIFYVAYIVKYCKKSERNFVSLLAMIDASETREEDEDFENAIDLMFKDIEFGNDEEGIEADPDSFAVRQYHKYKLAAGKTAKSILVSCGARLAPFVGVSQETTATEYLTANHREKISWCNQHTG